MTSQPYLLASTTWDQEEIDAIHRVLSSGNLTLGYEVKEFENEFARAMGAKYAVMFNSGSSANLAMVLALRYSEEYKLKLGSEIVVPAVSWSTTFYPVHQAGFKLRFVDIDGDSLNINISQIEENINENTGAIFAVNLLGNPAQLDAILSIAKRHNLIVLEDNCESLGASLHGKKSGTFGLVGSYSFYFSHHISTMEGGMVVTDSLEIQQILLSLRAHGWTRGLPVDNHVHPLSDDAWEDLFRFVLPGFNLRPLEISGAVGRVQLRKLDEIVSMRRMNASFFQEFFKDSDYFSIQLENGTSSWFGFSLVLKGMMRGKRRELINYLESREIQTRPIVAGNFLRNPVMKHLDYEASGVFEHANRIHEDGFFVGNHHFDISQDIERLALETKFFIEKELS